MTAGAAARDPDVVDTPQEAAAADRPPLVVREPLRAFLDRHAIGEGPMRTAPLGQGHSNVTYALERDGLRLVLRRPPRPPLPPSAHDVVREARLLTALGATGVRVPKVLVVCEDPGIIGAPFYLMEYLDGCEVSTHLPATMESAQARAAVCTELVDALVEIHAVDAGRPELTGFGRPVGYLERQLRRFTSIWADTRTRELPEVDRVSRWLAAHVPTARGHAVVHGDFRLGNVMYAGERRPRLQSVLDWEMATLGDPLADVGYLLATWAEPDDEDNPMLALSAVTRLPGFLSRDDLWARYVRQSGMNVERDELRWYEILAVWKCTVFLEASYARYLAGTTTDPYFGTLREGVPALAAAAVRRLEDDRS